jgi:hypothetical protein
LIKTIFATLSIKRVPDTEIIQEIERQTNNTITGSGLYKIKQQIKRESYDWYKNMREGLHEFKEGIDEILSLQKQHHEIIEKNEHNPQIQQTSLAELHRLSITLSNSYDVAPSIVNGITASTTPETKTINSEITV